MTGVDRESLGRKAAALQLIWLREREAQRALQLAANAEVRQRWIESDSFNGEAEPDSKQRETDQLTSIQP